MKGLNEEKKSKLSDLFSKKTDSTKNNKHRVADFCYGKDGLIDFLDLLFDQFPTKSQVRDTFNYYFAIRK